MAGLRILVITRGQVHPPRSGASLRNWQNINLLATLGRVSVFSLGTKTSSDRIQNPPRPINHLVEHAPLAPPRGSPASISNRLWFANPRAHPRVNRLFDRSGVRKLEQMMEFVRPQLVVVEEPWALRYVPMLRSNRFRSPKIVYDAHNVEAVLRWAMATDQTLAEISSARLLRLQARRIGKLESHLVHAADQVWVCSEDDRRAVANTHKREAQVFVVPNGVNVEDYKWATLPGLPSIPNLLFVGAFGYKPNAVAAEMLIKSIHPRVADAYPSTRLVLVGRGATNAMKAAAQRDRRVHVTGMVPDITPFLEAADIVVVPLLQGGGTRLKILEAFAALRPVVATTKAVSGLDITSGVHALIRDDPESLAESVVSLIQSPRRSQALAIAARTLVEVRYDWNVIVDHVSHALERLFGNGQTTTR